MKLLRYGLVGFLLFSCTPKASHVGSGGAAPTPTPTPSPTVAPTTPPVVAQPTPTPTPVMVNGTISFTTDKNVELNDCVKIATVLTGATLDPNTAQDLGCSRKGSPTTKPVQLSFYPGQCTQIALLLSSGGALWGNLTTPDIFARRIYRAGGWPKASSKSVVEFWLNDNDDKSFLDFYIKVEIPDPTVKYSIPGLVDFCN